MIYNNAWLDPDDTKCNVDEYFKQISYIISLEGKGINVTYTDLYTVLSTCYYNNDMQYCPILLEVGQERIRKVYDGCKYLIQVWKKDGTKSF